LKRILVANRGEIAIRIMRAAKDLEIQGVAVYSIDDYDSRHRIFADSAVALNGSGPSVLAPVEYGGAIKKCYFIRA
jgi:acetyl/propionyl-CoA carboxylase alpha subunit